ncbi:MAG: hypothetical protein NXI23_20755 [Bacteroidetes bacterium]|nr:hypothetical protein [Bacteroidota bacterium]
MNSRLKTLLFTVFFFVVSSALHGAVIFPKSILKEGYAKTAILYLEFDLEKDFEIRLIDEGSTVLLEQNVTSTKSFKKKYNLVNLPDGRYFFEIEDFQTIIIYEIKIERSRLKIKKKKERKIFKPNISQLGNILNCSMLLLDSSQTEITIFDKNHEILFSETIENQMTIEKSFDLSKLDRGKYFIQIENNHRFFEKAIFIKN